MGALQREQQLVLFRRQNLPEDDKYRIIAAEPAAEQDLPLICQKDYVDFMREYFKAANLDLSYPGQFYHYHSMDNMPVGRLGKVEEAARISIGQSKAVCGLVEKGKFKKVVSVGGALKMVSKV